MAKVVACRQCGSVDVARTKVKGSLLITLILLWFFIVPAIIYEIWRASTRAPTCRVCGSYDVVPSQSPEGRRIADRGAYYL